MIQTPCPNPFDLSDALSDYRQRYPAEATVVDEFQSLLSGRANCFERDCFRPGHVTGSAWLVDDSGEHVLLTHHRKLNAWLQLGGHSDGDPDTAAVAQREAEEESGLAAELLSRAILDIDVHEIPARKADPAHFHFDVRFVLVSCSGRDYVVSDESHDLARDAIMSSATNRMTWLGCPWRACSSSQPRLRSCGWHANGPPGAGS